MKQILLLIAAVMISVAGFGQELVVNGGFETWTDVNTPEGYNDIDGLTQESTIVHSGTYSAKQVGGRSDLSQTVNIEAGKTYTISLWYYVDTNTGDGTDARIWSYWRTGTTTISDNSSELRGPNNSYFTSEAAWNEYTVTLTAPASADNLDFEVRTYGDAVVYFDDFSVAETTVALVETPEFTPAEGVYYSTQSVALTCETVGATIYYTTDGSTPDNTSTEYVAPFDVASTTTVKAIAYKDGMQESVVVEATYSFPSEVSTIAELRLQAEGDDVYKLTGEAILTYQQSYRNNKCIQDVTGGITIDDADGVITTVYADGDGITGIVGKLGSYKGLLQFVPVADPGAATSTGNPVVAEEVTVAQLTAGWEAFESKLVVIDNVDFGTAGGTTFVNGTDYDVTVSGSAFVVRTHFYNFASEAIPSTAKVTGIAVERDVMTIAPRTMSDLGTATDVETAASASAIYPNPFIAQITVTADAIATVEVMNAVGQLVAKVEGGNMDKVVVPTADLAKGIYIVKVTEADGNVVTKKVMKK